MAHRTKDKGDLAVAKAIAHLLEHNIHVCLPLSEHLPFDLIAVMPDLTTLKRVQVKYRSDRGTGSLVIKFEANYYDSKHIYTKLVDLEKIDCYAAYNPTTGRMYYLNVTEIPEGTRGMCLRLQPTKNGQQRGIRLARDYEDPQRIAALGDIAVYPSRYIDSQTHLATAYVETDLLMQGWYTCSPQRWDAPFDLIAVSPDMLHLLRLRVGYGSTDVTPYTDAYALYHPDDKSVHYLSAAHIPREDRGVGFNLHPAMSSQLETALAG